MALCGRNKYILEFTVNDNNFPSTVDNWISNSKISFKTLISQSMYIDYGDGIVLEYKMNALYSTVIWNYANTSTTLLVPNIGTPPDTGTLNYRGYKYDESYTGIKTVKVSFDSPSSIIGISGSFLYNIIDEFPKGILKYTGITSFEFLYCPDFSRLPNDIITLTEITNLRLANCFTNSGSGYMEDYIPLGFFNLKLSRFDIDAIKLGDGIRSGKATNLGNIKLLKDTLTYIHMEACRLSNDNISTYISDSFAELYKLESLYIGYNYFETAPSFINRIPSLKTLQIGGGYSFDSRLKYWGDLSNLINLEVLNCPIASSIETSIPSYLKDMVILRTFNVVGSYKTQQRWDEFIYNLYEYITTNAIIDHDDTQSKVSCRNMDVLASRAGDVYIIQGTYQQPTGYEQGVSNGTPTSQLEKIWVLEHQYNVSVSYTDNR